VFKVILGLLLVTAVAVAVWRLARPGQIPAVGSAAPDFRLPDQDGKPRQLADYAGRWLVLYFYPRDDTPGCTREACCFRDDIGSLQRLGAAVIGVSLDDSASHAAFARKHQLPFPLLSDPAGKTAAAYGSLLNLGVVRLAHRHTFIIGPDGRIAAVFTRVDPDRHAAEVAQVLREIKRNPVKAGGLLQ
jgi:thioredoxin-dependent peroxiredoxin